MSNSTVKRKSIPKKLREEVYKMYNGHCAYCGLEIKYKEMQVDHVESLYWNNGKDDISNYKPACRMCNFYKSTMSLGEFREQIKTIPNRVDKEFIYRLGKRYGLIKEVDKDVKFYFESIVK